MEVNHMARRSLIGVPNTDTFRRMREIPRAPTSFSGTLDELYEKHAKHVLIDTGQIKEFHRALMDYLKMDDPVFLVRYVRDMERGKVIRTNRGHLVKGSDNAPPWYIHKNLYTQPFTGTHSCADFLTSAWCHFHNTHNHRPHINSQDWYVAHIFRAKDRNTAWHDWDREELTKRMVRNIHPCNYFYVPLNDGPKYGEDPTVISYFYDKFSRLYGDVWEEFLATADAAPIRNAPDIAHFEYSICTNHVTVPSEQQRKRMTFKRKWMGQGISVTFSHEGITYRYPHDELLEMLINQLDIIEGTVSWERDGNFNFPRLSKQQKLILEPYMVEQT